MNSHGGRSKRAIALKAADARGDPSKGLLAQVQRVFDDEIVTPEIAQHTNDIYKKAAIAQSRALVMGQ